VELEADIDPSLPRATIDERAIQLAVINLIDNALKYAPGTGVVSVRAKCERDAIVVRVVDRGPGVPAEDRDRIFERFVRGSTARTSAGPIRGSGIGLSLVKHIAESHGGRAWVENPEAASQADAPQGGGASFAIEIPTPASTPGAGGAPRRP
jgi:two-component system phosphate regulon sensor histidine kinase PhoR